MRTKDVKGITIVSLVVTIVVILILAGVTINVLVGDNGVINVSKEKNSKLAEKTAKEEMRTVVLEYGISSDGETLQEFLESKVPSRLDEVKKIADKTLEIKKNGYTIQVEIEEKKISLIVTPYTGIYDGNSHDALKSIEVIPRDAKIEYSTDDNTFSTTMPKITNASSITVTVRASKSGYTTITTKQTAKIEKAEGKITLSATNGTYTYPTSGTFTISENTGTISAVSNNTNIATVSTNSNIVTIKPGTTEGKTTITVKSAESNNYKEKTATYEANVKNGTISLSAIPYTGTYDGKAHNALTNVSVNPSDAVIEYSTDGTNYSETMPTVTNSSSFTVTVRASKAGYKTQSVTETVNVNKAAGSLSLSAMSGTITYPNSGAFTVSGNTGTISVTSSNTKVATVSISGNTVTIKSVGAGTATITVKSASNTNYNEKTVTYTVTVQDPTFTGNSGVGHYADTDGDGTPDGIIFVDLKNGASGSWGSGSYGSYSLSTVSGTKSYKVSQKNYNGPFGKKDVLVANGSGNNRFYVMALSDYNNGNTYQFNSAKSITSGEWKTPTKDLWAAFGGELGITTSNYSGYGLEDIYWSSSAKSTNTGYYVSFNGGKIDSRTFVGILNLWYYVRLYRTL